MKPEQIEALQRTDGTLDFEATYSALDAAFTKQGPVEPGLIRAVAGIVTAGLAGAEHPLSAKYGMEYSPASQLVLQDYDGEVPYCLACSYGKEINIYFDAETWEHAMFWNGREFASETVVATVTPSGSRCQIYYDHPGDPEVRGTGNNYVAAVLDGIFGIEKSGNSI